MSLKRRKTISLVLSLLIVVSMIISACGGPEPAPMGTSQEEAKAEGSEAKEEMMEVDLSPSEFPEPQLIVGSRPVQKLPLDQIVTYKALDSYSEPDWISELVAAGELPPVEERLSVECPASLVTLGEDLGGQVPELPSLNWEMPVIRLPGGMRLPFLND